MIRRSQIGEILGKNFQAERKTGMKAEDRRGVALNLEGREKLYGSKRFIQYHCHVFGEDGIIRHLLAFLGNKQTLVYVFITATEFLLILSYWHTLPGRRKSSSGIGCSLAKEGQDCISLGEL